MITMLIVDDHPIYRAGVRQVLNESRELGLVAIEEADTGQEALQLLSRKTFDVVLLDISMPGMSGLEVLKEIHTNGLAERVLVLSTYPEEQYALEAIKNGAAGYITKQGVYHELVTAVRQVLEGRMYVTPNVAQQLVLEIRGEMGCAPHQRLSVREYEVIRLIASGKSTKEIANILSISKSAVSTYRARALEKMKLRSNAELIRYAVKHGLVD